MMKEKRKKKKKLNKKKSYSFEYNINIYKLKDIYNTLLDNITINDEEITNIMKNYLKNSMIHIIQYQQNYTKQLAFLIFQQNYYQNFI